MVEKAIDAKIPVFVLDRNVDTDQYTQFVGGDNKLIGRAAGEYAVELLGGPGKAKGNVVEIWGGMGTQPAHDRHDGFHEFTDKEPGIKNLLDQQSGDWKQDQAYNIMATALRNNEKIDLVYGHNDPMAYGAYLAAKDVGREKEIKFIGIDALPDEGVTWVNNGELTATFLYATPGAEGLRQALKFLNGEKVEKTIMLDTKTVTKENADEILKANGLLVSGAAAALARRRRNTELVPSVPPARSEDRGRPRRGDRRAGHVAGARAVEGVGRHRAGQAEVEVEQRAPVEAGGAEGAPCPRGRRSLPASADRCTPAARARTRRTRATGVKSLG